MMLERYKGFYDDEINRKDKINDKIGTAMLLITLYVAGTNIVLKEMLEMAPCSFVFSISLALFLFSILSFVASLFFCVRAFYGYKYSYMGAEKVSAALAEILAYYDKWYDEYYSSSADTKEKLVNADFEEALSEEYKKAASTAFRHNNLKSERFSKFSYCVIASLILISFDLLTIYLVPIFS